MRKKSKVRTRSWDIARGMTSDEERAEYLEAALEDGDPALIISILGHIARSRGMTEVARETGLGRESLYKALSAEGNPAFATVLQVIHALGLRLHVSKA
ncbi:MAG TPA: addiction module antidote protein [Steroidobacteraceae bacterium]|nr:addiction module antidote protein [Steroidobacteraceae bacterium]